MRVGFSERELDVMAVLWDRGPSTTAEVNAALSDDLAYNTVLTVLRILEEKGHVGHVAEGRVHRYHALVDREVAGASAAERIKDKMFGGSAELLLTNFVDRQKLTTEEIRRLRKLLDERLKRGGR